MGKRTLSYALCFEYVLDATLFFIQHAAIIKFNNITSSIYIGSFHRIRYHEGHGWEPIPYSAGLVNNTRHDSLSNISGLGKQYPGSGHALIHELPLHILCEVMVMS